MLLLKAVKRLNQVSTMEKEKVQDSVDTEDDISEKLKNLIMMSQRSRADWEQKRSQPTDGNNFEPS